MQRTALILIATLMLGGLPACGKRTRPLGTASSASAPPLASSLAADEGPLGFQYPPGRWRLAMFEELDRSTLWVGHIVIRHQQSNADLFRPPGWRPDSPNPPRSATEALALAEKVRARAAGAPQDFERLAREYSEDVVSKEEGGMLGGVRATQLVAPDFLDALAALKPGEISQPFRTPYGFHILKRYAPPEEQQLAGERIVIGYDGVYGLATPTKRTRAEALTLARDVAERARKDSHDFRALVERFSDSVDRVNHGDLGVYSSRDPGPFPMAIHRLTGVAVGEVTGPVETRFGFEILKRVPVTPRKQYAMAAIEFGFGLESGDPDAVKAAALKSAEGVRRELQGAPDRFRDFQLSVCCDRVQRWSEGRGDIELTRALDGLAYGEIAKKPLLVGAGYFLIKRLDPSALPPEAPRRFEVPNPTDPDYDAIASANDGTQFAAAARAFIDAMRASSAIAPQAKETVAATLASAAQYSEQNQLDRVATRAQAHATLATLERQLGAEQFGQLKSFGRQWIIRQMMPPGSVD